MVYGAQFALQSSSFPLIGPCEVGRFLRFTKAATFNHSKYFICTRKASAKDVPCSSPSTSFRPQSDLWWVVLYDNCGDEKCHKHHICLVCKRPAHQSRNCPKWKYAVPLRRQDTTPNEWLLQGPPSPNKHNPCPHLPMTVPGLYFPPIDPSKPAHHASAQVLAQTRVHQKFIALHARLQWARGPNAYTIKIPVPSNLKISAWRHRLVSYPDTRLCDFLEFGWPVGFMDSDLPTCSSRNHSSANVQPALIDACLKKESALGAMCGPFPGNPLTTPLTTSPLQVTYSRSGKSRVVVDLSFSSR